MSDHVTLDRAVVERLLWLAQDHAGDCDECAPEFDVLHEALADADSNSCICGHSATWPPPCRPRPEPEDEPVPDTVRDALRGAEPEPPQCGVVFYGLSCTLPPGHPDEHFCRTDQVRTPDPMPEPTSGSVVVTIDGRHVRFLRSDVPLDPEHPVRWLMDPRVPGVRWQTWQQVLDARDPGTEVRRG